MANYKCVRFKPYAKGAMLGFADLGILDAQGRVLGVVLGFKLMKGQDGEWLSKPDKERMVKVGEHKEGNGTYDPTFFFGDRDDEERSKALEQEALRVVLAASLVA